MITDAMDNVKIKQEITDQSESPSKNPTDSTPAINMDISDSGSNSDSDSYVSSDTDLEDDQPSRKKTKSQVVLPLGFMDPLPPEERALFRKNVTAAAAAVVTETTLAITPTQTATPVSHENYKQFWKAGDYEGFHADDSAARNVGMDHLRVHPKFLHSNATSHKWALGAMAELLDNALDEICNGASYVNIDMLENKKDKNRMLLVEDNGGGMSPDTMRQCMSLGYSVKSKLANTIGQYGNGFKTSTMRLGADVIVFSRCRGKEGRRPTQSIGMLSYTFLRRTGKEDIVVPMIDYEKQGENWSIMERSSYVDWKRNLETMITWSPYATEEDLLQEFELMNDKGTRIVIYNLWEDDEGQLELDFDTDKHDIQIKGANRDVKNIKMAQTYPNSKHFLTYRYSLRSYASILYLRIPDGFRIILRGRNVDHHNLVNDMMLSQKITYKPIGDPQVTTKDPNMVADVTIGFVKDAMCHIDVQGFNVYHKNRLIKPFWRVWNAAGSDGRGVIGVLEANFIEPAHDKQGFERTIVLSRLEQRLVLMQKTFWSTNCHEIGYAKRRHPNQSASPSMESSAPAKASPHPNLSRHDSGNVRSSVKSKRNCDRKLPFENASEAEMGTPGVARAQISQRLHVESARKIGNGHAHVDSNAELAKLKDENLKLKETLQKMDGLKVEDLLRDLQYERDRNKSVENKYQKAREKLEEMDKEHETLINIFDEERGRREKEEESLRMTLKDAYETIEGLAKKVKMLEGKTFSCKTER